MPAQPPTSIAEINFGTRNTPDVPDEQPSPATQILFTAWHLDKLLEAIESNRLHPVHRRANHVAEFFSVFTDLTLVRPIQPMQQVVGRRCVTVTIPTPVMPRQQQAMLLYAFHPGQQGKLCGACRSHAATGPFKECVSGGEFSMHACINCYWSGTGPQCLLRREHERRLAERQAIALGTLPIFPTNAEKKANAGELELWLQQVEGALRMRAEAKLNEERQRLAVPRGDSQRLATPRSQRQRSEDFITDDIMDWA